MTHHEMTIAEVLNDPLIRQMMEADRVSLGEMKELLHNAAHKRRISRQTRHTPETAGYLSRWPISGSSDGVPAKCACCSSPE